MGYLLDNLDSVLEDDLGNPLTDYFVITAGPVRIMPLGDSITAGQNTPYGAYRRHLYERLTTDGVNVNFVGALSAGDFADPDHYGVTGDVINGTWGLVATGLIIEAYTPDIILLMIGTNDVWHGDGDITAALVTYGHLLDSIAEHGPNVKTLVGSIPPIDVAVAGSTVTANVDVFNSGLASLVATKSANFIFVDINAGLTTTDLVDGVHPTDAGNDKLANLWYPAITALLAGDTVVFADRVLDLGLSILADEANALFLCSNAPTDYSTALSLRLASKTGTIFNAPAAASGGRKVVSNAISDGSNLADGTVTHWAAVDTVNTRLLAHGPVAASHAIRNGQKFTVPAFVLTLDRG